MAQDVIEITEREVEIIEVIERGPVGQTGPQPNINYEVVSSSRTVTSRQLIAADTSGGSFTLTLPLNPAAGDAVDIFDYSETFDTNPLTIARNNQPIESLNEDLVANVEGAYFTLIYTGDTRGWQVVPRFGTSGGGGETVLTTQGDMLYRGVGINTRLPIGSAGQILKVNSGATAPEWGAAPATGVTSVGITGSDGIEVDSGSPVTGSGSIALGVNAASLRSHINVADGANNYTHPNHTGEVTSSGDGATTIANDAVTNTKLSNMAQSTLKGRATASTGDPEDLSASQVRTILNVADGAEVNVQSNWTEADSGSDAFILNKPTLGNSSALDIGTVTGTVAAGDDARFTDNRDPNLHAASHAAAGSDPVFDQDLNTTDEVEFYGFRVGNVAFDASNVDDPQYVFFPNSSGNIVLDSALGTAATADIGTGAGEVAEGDHTHELDELDATGATNGHVLTADGSNGASWQAASGGDTVSIEASAADVLSVSSGAISADDAGADKIVYWKDADSKLAYGSVADVGAAAASHDHTAADIDSQTATDGFVLTADGAGGAAWEAASGGIGGSTGSTDNALLRADGTGGATAQASSIEIDDAVRAFSVTGDASTDVITATGHNYVNGQVIRFVGLAGGSGLSNATNYFVRDAATDTFKVSTTSAGAAVNFTTNITSGSAIAVQETVTMRLRVAKFPFTAVASTDIITAVGHNFIEHDPVSFSQMVGGAGLNAAVVYFVRDISGDTFKVSTSAGGAATNITTDYTGGNVDLVAALVLTTPNMSGFIVGPKPDGTTHGGNIRGQGAIDIQPTRSGAAATAVASGVLSIAIGDNVTSSNTRSICIGSNGSIASGIGSVALGAANAASARSAVAMGSSALADRSGRAFCHHSNSAQGHRQELQFLLTRTTTNDTASEMWADEYASARVTIPSGKVMGGIVCVTGSKSDGSAVALYTRQFVIKNVGGTTTLLSSSTIGTDYEDAATDITVEANDTNDALRVLVTGISGENWRWTGWLHCTEHFYGT